MDSKATRKYEISRVTGQEAFTLADLEAFVRSCQKAGLAPTSQLLAESVAGRRGELGASDLLTLRAVESEAARKKFWDAPVPPDSDLLTLRAVESEAAPPDSDQSPFKIIGLAEAIINPDLIKMLNRGETVTPVRDNPQA